MNMLCDIKAAVLAVNTLITQDLNLVMHWAVLDISVTHQRSQQ